MTERGRSALERSRESFVLGRSRLTWDGAGLDVFIDETCAPLPRRVRGHVRLDCEGVNARTFELDRVGGHQWRPIAPCARVQVRMEQPSLSWRGVGYFDANRGDEPLEDGFRSWTWSRASFGGGARVFYDAERRREPPLALSLAFAADGTAREIESPARVVLPKSFWRVARQTRSDGLAKVESSLEDAPFYARARISHRLEGRDAVSMHEALDLDRFASPVVKAMLPFRMPRAFY